MSCGSPRGYVTDAPTLNDLRDGGGNTTAYFSEIHPEYVHL